MAQSSRPRRKHALIVEDEIMVALGLEADLQELGFGTCYLAANGRQAFLHATSHRPEVALMDINLEGGREGIEVARRLRELCDVPVMFPARERVSERPAGQNCCQNERSVR